MAFVVVCAPLGSPGYSSSIGAGGRRMLITRIVDRESGRTAGWHDPDMRIYELRCTFRPQDLTEDIAPADLTSPPLRTWNGRQVLAVLAPTRQSSSAVRWTPDVQRGNVSYHLAADLWDDLREVRRDV